MVTSGAGARRKAAAVDCARDGVVSAAKMSGTCVRVSRARVAEKAGDAKMEDRKPPAWRETAMCADVDACGERATTNEQPETAKGRNCDRKTTRSSQSTEKPQDVTPSHAIECTDNTSNDNANNMAILNADRSRRANQKNC